MRFADGRGLCVTLLGAALAACGSGDGSAAGTVFRDSAGVTIVENDYARPAWGADTGRVAGTPLLQVGGAEVDGPEQFLGITHTALLPDGRLAVVNSQLQRVVLFDAEGRFQRTIGRKGDGPGEFRDPRWVYPHSGDSILVIDGQHYTSVFDGEGRYARRFAPGEVTGVTQGMPKGQFADGTLLFAQNPPHESGPMVVGWRRSQIEPARVGLDGLVVGRFGRYDDQLINYGASVRHLFAPWSAIAAGRDGFWYGPGDRVDLRQVGLDGQVRRIVRLALPLRRVTPEDKESFRSGMRAAARGTPAEAMIDRIYAGAETPEFLPAHGTIQVDDRERIWVREYEVSPRREPGRWYLFDPEGRYLGKVVMPAGFRPHQIAGGKVVGRWADEDGVEFVRVYEMSIPRP